MNITTENIFRSRSTNDSASIFILDESLETHAAGRCDLLVSVEPGGIQIALKERKDNLFLALEFFPADPKRVELQWTELLERVSAKSKLLRTYEFSKVIVNVHSPVYTLVPDGLFKKGDEQGYLQFNLPTDQDMSVYASPVPFFQLYSIFGIPTSLITELNHLFEDPEIVHHSKSLLESTSMYARNHDERQLFLNIYGNSMDAIVTEGKKLILMNSYSCNGIEDTLYYVLFLCEQLDMNPEELQVKLAGEIEKESALYKLLFRYIRNLNFSLRPGPAEYSYGFQELPAQFFHPLFSLSLCES
ncbi:MAG: DUF3822 family protein [Bacteroidetes bacterium]|nr:DUF3822 family protein [Bacteroidota bacterium]